MASTEVMDNMDIIVTLPVYIEAEGRVIDLKISKKDAERATNDSSFLEELVAVHSASEPSAAVEASTLPTVIPTEAGTNNDETTSLFLWSPACVQLLLALYEERDHVFGSGTKRHNQLWKEIANCMGTHGYDVTGAQCQSKLNGLKKTYKKILDHNGTSGNDRRTWPYFDKMNEIFGRTSWVQPQALATEAGPSSSETHSPEPKKRKRSLLEKIRTDMQDRQREKDRRRQEAEEAKIKKIEEMMRQKESHHRERMEMMGRILDNFRN